jgi:hypothetical protein
VKLAATSAALVIASAALPVFAAQTYGAIAVSTNAGIWSSSFDYDSQTAADARALEECRKQLNGRADDCQIASRAPAPSCAAVAVKYADGRKAFRAWGGDAATDLDAAHAKAMTVCTRRAKEPCDEVVADVCSENY